MSQSPNLTPGIMVVSSAVEPQCHAQEVPESPSLNNKLWVLTLCKRPLSIARLCWQVWLLLPTGLCITCHIVNTPFKGNLLVSRVDLHPKEEEMNTQESSLTCPSSHWPKSWANGNKIDNYLSDTQHLFGNMSSHPEIRYLSPSIKISRVAPPFTGSTITD